MIMIYTSYYANSRNLKNNPILIQISRSKPVNIKVDYNIINFAPSYKLLSDYKNNYCNKVEYTKRYIDELNQYPKERYLKFIDWCKKQTKDIILLCYEGKAKFCHRHILANYLMNIDKNLSITEY